MGNLFKRASLAAVLMLSAACTTSQTQVPGLAGPSELALSLRVAAIPDSISQDGASQSSIVVSAFDSNGKPCGSLPVRMDMSVGGSIQDFGTLSGRTIVTGSNGQASTVYTAPPAPPPSAGGSGTMVTIVATPSSSVSCGSTPAVSNFDAVNRQETTIRLVPPGVILPPAGSPTAAFTMSPLQAVQNAPVTLDASTSTPGSGAIQISSYSWNFGDGTADATGRTVTHTFTSQQTFNVTLTVTNDRGLSASTRVPTIVGAPPTATPPTPVFTFSPASAGVNDTIFFNASTSTAAAGHRIVNFTWAFGDGATATGVTTTHAYVTAGTYVVQLSVVDESGQAATSAGTSITIGGASPSAPTANFTFSPLNPVINEQVVFDSSSTTVASGQSIVDVAWNFGDDTPIIHGPAASTRITAHTYARAGTFVVNLVVTDSVGRTGQKNLSVPVGNGNPIAVLSLNKTGAFSILADAAGSFATGTSSIVSYRFIWGDGSADTVILTSAPPTAPHTYGSFGVQTVTLIVTDNAAPARTGRITTTITLP